MAFSHQKSTNLTSEITFLWWTYIFGTTFDSGSGIRENTVALGISKINIVHVLSVN